MREKGFGDRNVFFVVEQLVFCGYEYNVRDYTNPPMREAHRSKLIINGLHCLYRW